MDPSDDNARHIGIVESIPAGVQRDFTPIEFSAQGRDHLRDFMEGDEYKSPFNVIVSTNLALNAGDLVPSGRARIAVHIIATARPSL